MGITNRNTIGETWADFFAHMQELAKTAEFEAVGEGEAAISALPKPSVVLQLLSWKTVSRANTGKVWSVAIRIHAAAEVVGSLTATSTILEKTAAIEDKIEGYNRPQGVEGFGDGEWSASFPIDPQTGGVVLATSTRHFTVAVAKGQN